MASSAMLQRFQQRLPLLLSAVVVVAFGAYLAMQINDWLAITRTPVETRDDAAAVAGVVPDLQRMETLFGAPAPLQVPASSLSSVDLTLHGSFVHAEPERSIAIIQRAGGVPELFHPGDELDSGLSLQTVYADRVELLRNGSLETLYFPVTHSAPLLPEDLSNLNEPAPSPPTEGSENPDSALLQQMEALRQQLETSDAPVDETASE
ncbi:type II secretion system protein N [Stutzerimonas nitrititolerans]|uniref:type II secretion system protein N n=1 Tax=Stutzerimonas nitrititolerans TaxID=2482751 RepID=UPI00289D668B|nr:type II secretion system protein N [Stutzerimonas nitrititolerans]